MCLSNGNYSKKWKLHPRAGVDSKERIISGVLRRVYWQKFAKVTSPSCTLFFSPIFLSSCPTIFLDSALSLIPFYNTKIFSYFLSSCTHFFFPVFSWLIFLHHFHVSVTHWFAFGTVLFSSVPVFYSDFYSAGMSKNIKGLLKETNQHNAQLNIYNFTSLQLHVSVSVDHLQSACSYRVHKLKQYVLTSKI